MSYEEPWPEKRADTIGGNGNDGDHYLEGLELLRTLAGRSVTVVTGDGLLGVIDGETEELYVLESK